MEVWLVMLSVVLPTHSEAAVIEETLRQLSGILADRDYEIVVVDDGSTDETPQIVAAYAQGHGRVRLIRKSGKAGAAKAIQTGVEAARGDIVVTMNADLQHPADLLPTMLGQVEQGCDIVIASRYVPHGDAGMSAFRTAVSRTAIMLARLLFPRVRAIRDPLAGYFMFRKNVAADVKLMPSSSDSRVAIGLKYLLALLVLGRAARVCEVPCYMRRRHTGRSKFSVWDVGKFARHLIYLMMNSGEAKRLAIFCIYGATAFVVYESSLYALTDRLRWHYLVSAVAAWFLAFLWNFLLNDVFTFAGARKHSARLGRGVRFFGVKVVGLVLHLLILATLTSLVGLHYLVSAALAVALVVAWNYVASVGFVWGVAGERH